MPAFICNTCGTQYEPSDKPPANCPICDDERQYVPPPGQSWITHDALAKRYYNGWKELEPNLISITTFPAFGIGQRAQLLRTPNGNILWDCISLIDDATVTMIKGLGGLAAIAISHPHFYTTMVEWSRAFDNVPIHLHAADRRWIMRDNPSIQLWDGATLPLLPGVTLIRGGGHFPGGTMLHWAAGAQGRGVVCSSDIATVTPDRKFLSFMWSYPNLIPLSAREVEGIAASLAPFAFDTIYGHFFDRVIATGAKAVLAASVARYLAAISGTAAPARERAVE